MAPLTISLTLVDGKGAIDIDPSRIIGMKSDGSSTVVSYRVGLARSGAPILTPYGVEESVEQIRKLIEQRSP